MTHCGQSCVVRQFIMVSNQKYQTHNAVASTSHSQPKKSKQLTPELKTGAKPTGCKLASF
jgi:hypothetical protein